MTNYLMRLSLKGNVFSRFKLRDTYSLHKMVYDLFEDVRAGGEGSSGILWSLESNAQGIYLLIKSDRKPRPETADKARAIPEIKEIPESLFNGKCYRFQVTINPVRRDGQRVPVKGAEAIAQWFCDKAPAWGFAVNKDNLEVGEIAVDTFTAKQQVTLQKARLSGLLEVTDQEKFKQAVLGGVGHGKAFGCGLLQVVPLKG